MFKAVYFKVDTPGEDIESALHAIQRHMLFKKHASLPDVFAIKTSRSARIVFVSRVITGQGKALIMTGHFDDHDRYEHHLAHMVIPEGFSPANYIARTIHPHATGGTAAGGHAGAAASSANPDVDEFVAYNNQFFKPSERQGHAYNTLQKRSLSTTVKCLWGGAGSGKTLIAMRHIAEQPGERKIVYLAPTGLLANSMQAMLEKAGVTNATCCSLAALARGKTTNINAFTQFQATFKTGEKTLNDHEHFKLYNNICKLASVKSAGVTTGKTFNSFNTHEHKLFSRYATWLDANKVDYADINLVIGIQFDELAADCLIVDEAQQMPFRFLKSLSEISRETLFLGDPHQALNDNAHIALHFLRNFDSTSATLEKTFRAPDSIVRVANAMLRKKHQLYQTKAFTPLTRAGQKQGMVNCIGQKALGVITQSLPITTAVICLDSSMMTWAQRKFGQENVYHVSQIIGLEYDNVIVAIGAAELKILSGKNHCGSSAVFDNAHELTVFNAFFVAVTRALERVCLVAENITTLTKLCENISQNSGSQIYPTEMKMRD